MTHGLQVPGRGAGRLRTTYAEADALPHDGAPRRGHPIPAACAAASAGDLRGVEPHNPSCLAARADGPEGGRKLHPLPSSGSCDVLARHATHRSGIEVIIC